jgi:hypothetical protein
MTDFVTIARRVRAVVTLAVTLVMVYALVVSREHITHVAYWLGIPGWQAETAFILVDLPALIGRVLQLKYFDADVTQRVGRRLTYFSGSLSLAANVASGVILGSYGAAGWGAFVVVMFVVLEGVIAKISPAAKDETSDESETAADISTAELESPVLPEAPVSPAPAPMAAIPTAPASSKARAAYGPRDGQQYSKRHARRLENGR